MPNVIAPDLPGLYVPGPGEKVIITWRHPATQLPEEFAVGVEVEVNDAWVYGDNAGIVSRGVTYVDKDGKTVAHKRWIVLCPKTGAGGWCRVCPSGVISK